jgi:hypothetical protein
MRWWAFFWSPTWTCNIHFNLCMLCELELWDKDFAACKHDYHFVLLRGIEHPSQTKAMIFFFLSCSDNRWMAVHLLQKHSVKKHSFLSFGL